MDSFWDFIWIFFWSFAFVAYLMALFSIITDLFRDKELNGWWKAVWIAFLVFFPFITALVYLVARGSGTAERTRSYAQRSRADTESYIRSVATTPSPADENAKAKALHNDGVITDDEYWSLKSRALAHP
jgi:hypothetical protein